MEQTTLDLLTLFIQSTDASIRLDSEKEAQAYLRNNIDIDEAPEWVRQEWYYANDLDKELCDNNDWQDPPECYADGHDWKYIGIPCDEAFRNIGTIYASDGAAVWHHEDPARFERLAKRLHRIVEEAEDNWQVRLVDPGFIPNSPKYGRVDDGCMIVGTLPVVAEVEITGRDGQGLGIYDLREYAYLEVGVMV